MFRKIVAGRHGSCESGRPERAGFAAVVAAIAADLFCGIRVIAGVYGICGVRGFFDVALHAAVVVAVSAFFGHSGVPPLGLIWVDCCIWCRYNFSGFLKIILTFCIV
jgi:hypothetical protein